MSDAATVNETRHFSDDERDRFRRDGFIFVPGLLSAGEMRRVTTWVDELESFPQVPGKSMFYYEDSVTDPARRVLSRVEYFADFHERLGALMRGSELIGRISELFGEPAVLFKDKVNFKMSGGQGFEPHQDMQAGWRDYGALQITAMISVDARSTRASSSGSLRSKRRFGWRLPSPA